MRDSFSDEGKAMLDQMMDIVEADINKAIDEIGRHHFLPVYKSDPDWLEKLKFRLRLLCFWRVAHGMQPGTDDPWPLLLTDK